ncbi:MAG: AMP-binding protein [Pseudomonadota bacterium]
MAGSVYFAGDDFAAATLATEAACAASGFSALGAKGGRVALFLRNDVSFLTASEAARLSGAATLPLNWRLKADDVAYILTDSATDLVVAHADLWHGIADQLPANVRDRLTVLLVPTPVSICSAYNVDPARAHVPPDGCHWVDFVQRYDPIATPQTTVQYPLIYTSGTTGRPKGVQRTTTGRPAPVAYDAFFNKDMCTLLATPLYHAAANRFLQGTFQIGGTLVLPARFDAEDTLSAIETHRVTTSFMVPAMLQRMIRLPDTVRNAFDPSSLKQVVIAGAPCPADLKAAMIDWWGPVIYEYYGSTETSALTFASSDDALARPGTVGRAVQTARVEVRDNTGAPCPPGQSGEIYGRRADIPDFTYLNAPEARAQAGTDDLITVGDIGYLDEEGYLFLNDRKSDMIISNGVNIYPAQVEAAILTHPAISDCAVFGIPDPSAGEAVAAIVQTSKDKPLEPAALIAYLKERVASYLVPKHVEQRQDFPRDEAGKIKKRNLRAPFWEGVDRKI